MLEVGHDNGDLALFLAETATRVTALRQDLAGVQRTLASCRRSPRVLAVTERLFTSLTSQKFDVVVLLDPPANAWQDSVEEGAGKLAAVLSRARSHLKPGGVLIIAIDNRFALRHLAGQGEIGHSHRLFSLEGLTRPDGFVLPGRRELQCALRDIGLPHQDWWFPFPDHRSPLTLVAERGFDPAEGLDVAALIAPSFPLDPRNAARSTFSIQRAFAAAAENGLLADLTNAFVVACSDHPFQTQTPLALHYGHSRRAAFEKEVRFEKVGETVQVRRRPLYGGRPETLDGVTNRFPTERLETGCHWPTSLQRILAQPGWTTSDLGEWALVWQQAVTATYGLVETPSLTTLLPGWAVDAVPHNLIVRSDESAFIDVEWDYGAPIEFGWLLVRGMLHVLQQSVDSAPPSEGTSLRLIDLIIGVAASLGHTLGPEAFRAYFACEVRLQAIVTGKPVAGSFETLADTRLHLRSSATEQLTLAEGKLAIATTAYDELHTTHESLKRQFFRLEKELLHSRLRRDREFRALQADQQAQLRIRAHLESEIARHQSVSGSMKASWRDRLGLLLRRSG